MAERNEEEEERKNRRKRDKKGEIKKDIKREEERHDMGMHDARSKITGFADPAIMAL